MKKSITSMFLAVLCMFALAGCSGVKKYNAVMYSHAQNWLTQEFQRENQVDSYYEINPDYVPNVSSPDEQYIRGKSTDCERTIIIKTKEEFDKAFEKCDYAVDFEKEVVLIYIFGDCYLRDYDLKKITLKDKTLDIEFKLCETFPPYIKDAIEIYQRCFFVKMNKVEFDTVNFIEQR